MISNRREKLKSVSDHVSIFSRLERYVAQMTSESSGHAVIAHRDHARRVGHGDIR